MSIIVGLFLASTCSMERIKAFISFEKGPVIGGNAPFNILKANKGNEFA